MNVRLLCRDGNGSLNFLPPSRQIDAQSLPGNERGRYARIAEQNTVQSGHQVCHRRRTYDTRKCHDAIARRGTCAVILLRKNAKPWQLISTKANALNEAVDGSCYLEKAERLPLP